MQQDAVQSVTYRVLGEKEDVIFFKPDRQLSDEEAEREYELHHLKPVDSRLLAAINETDPDFLSEHPSVTFRRGRDGALCYSAFSKWYAKGGMNVCHDETGWSPGWWFAGAPK